MSRLVIALDESPATSALLATARAIADLLPAQIDPVQVVDAQGAVNGGRGGVAERAVRAHGLSLRTVEGPLVPTLVAIGAADDVAAMVVGARRSSTGPRPLGSTALALATFLPKPIVVVAPDARTSASIRRVLVPVEGAPSSSGVPPMLLGFLSHADLEIDAVYVAGESDLPAFTDQPQHEGRAWADEFLRRYCAAEAGALRLRTHIGRPEELIPLVSERIDPDLIALSWSQQPGPGRAAVVRAVLDQSRRPVLLVPVAPNRRDDTRDGSPVGTANSP